MVRKLYWSLLLSVGLLALLCPVLVRALYAESPAKQAEIASFTVYDGESEPPFAPGGFMPDGRSL